MGRVIAMAAVDQQVIGSRGIVRVSGDVGPLAGARLMRQNGEWMQREALLAQVVDYSAATLCMTPERMFGNAVAASRHAQEFTLPTVFVVRQEQRALFDQYVRLMRQGGLVKRAVLTDAWAAQEWAAKMADVERYYQRLQQQRRQSCPEPPRTG